MTRVCGASSITGSRPRAQPRRSPCLDHAGRLIGAGLLARATGVLGPPSHDHFEPGRNLVEPLGSILADHVQIAATARADLALWLDHHLLARQVRRKMTAVDFTGSFARRCSVASAFSCAASPYAIAVSKSSRPRLSWSSLRRSD